MILTENTIKGKEIRVKCVYGLMRIDQFRLMQLKIITWKSMQDDLFRCSNPAARAQTKINGNYAF